MSQTWSGRQPSTMCAWRRETERVSPKADGAPAGGGEGGGGGGGRGAAAPSVLGPPAWFHIRRTSLSGSEMPRSCRPRRNSCECK